MEQHVIIICKNTLNSKKFWLYMWKTIRYAKEEFGCKQSIEKEINNDNYDDGFD